MQLRAEHLSKRFERLRVLQDLNAQFDSPDWYGITGRNGSGKSTLLRILSGQMMPSSGKVRYLLEGKDLPASDWYRKISFQAPYVDIPDECTLAEIFVFHRAFRDFVSGFLPEDVLRLTGLDKYRNKPVRFFSSGMKQRVRLALAILTQSQVLFLDEPTTNLDRAGIAWFHELMREFAVNRLVLIASNVEEDLRHCHRRLDLSE